LAHVIDPKGGIDEQFSLASASRRAKQKFADFALFMNDFWRHAHVEGAIAVSLYV